MTLRILMVLVLLASSSAAQAQGAWGPTDLGTLGGVNSFATSINSAGVSGLLEFETNWLKR